VVNGRSVWMGQVNLAGDLEGEIDAARWDELALVIISSGPDELGAGDIDFGHGLLLSIAHK
jgi:hypothetical protein